MGIGTRNQNINHCAGSLQPGLIRFQQEHEAPYLGWMGVVVQWFMGILTVQSRGISKRSTLFEAVPLELNFLHIWVASYLQQPLEKHCPMPPVQLVGPRQLNHASECIEKSTMKMAGEELKFLKRSSVSFILFFLFAPLIEQILPLCLRVPQSFLLLI